MLKRLIDERGRFVLWGYHGSCFHLCKIFMSGRCSPVFVEFLIMRRSWKRSGVESERFLSQVRWKSSSQQAALAGRHLQWSHQLFSLYLPFSCVIFCSLPAFITLFWPTLFACFFSVTLLFPPLSSIHVSFHCQTPVVFSRLAADLMTSAPPQPTRARRFLLPFVFCSDSPPTGILWHSSDHRWRNASTKLWCGKLKAM